jgi:hypothetical protein
MAYRAARRLLAGLTIFFALMAFKMSICTVKSATMRLSRPFSSANALAWRSSSTCIPP